MIALAVLASALAGSPEVAGGLSLEPVGSIVLAAKSRSGYRLVAELIVRNDTDETIGIDRVTFDLGDGKPIEWSGKNVVDHFASVGTSGRLRDEPTRWVRAKGFGVLFADPDVALPKAPGSVRVTVVGDDGEKASATLEMRAFEPVTRFRLPVHGDEWISRKGPPTPSSNRRIVVETQNEFVCPHRFALELVRTNVAGATRDSEDRKRSSAFAYGEVVVAAAAGTVVAVIDRFPDHDVGGATRDAGAGNRVSIDHGDGVFSHVTHLQEGSLRVAAGDRVEAGDVLGLVGNSGDSVEPALGFSLTDGKDPDRSQGLPCLFSDVVARGAKDATLLAAEMPLADDHLTDGRPPRSLSPAFGIGPFRRLPKNPVLRAQGTGFWPRAVSQSAAVVLGEEVVFACGLQEPGADAGGVSFVSLPRSKDGIRFELEAEELQRPFSESAGRRLDEPRLVKINERFVLTYLVTEGTTKRLAIATSASASTIDGLRSFERKGFALGGRAVDGPGVIAPEKIGGRFVMYFGAPEIRVATSSDLSTWDVREEPVLGPRAKRFDASRVAPGAPPVLTERGILLVYDGVDANGRTAMGQALFSRDDPAKVLGRSDVPFFEPLEGFERFGLERDRTSAVGLVRFGERWFLYYGAAGNAVGVASTER